MLEAVKSATPNILHYNGGGVGHNSSTNESKEIFTQKSNIENELQSNQEQNKNTKEDNLIEELNEISESLKVDVKFAYNDKIDEVYINVIDKESGKIIRKLPSEEAMKIKETMKDFIGSLFDTKG